jgi:hypothetical protein
MNALLLLFIIYLFCFKYFTFKVVAQRAKKVIGLIMSNDNDDFQWVVK